MFKRIILSGLILIIFVLIFVFGARENPSVQEMEKQKTSDYTSIFYDNIRVRKIGKKNNPFIAEKFDIGHYTNGYVRNYNKTEYKFEHYGVGPYDMEGNLVDERILNMYEYFGITDVEKIFENPIFSEENLSAFDSATGDFLISDTELAGYVGSIVTESKSYTIYPSGMRVTETAAENYLNNVTLSSEWDTAAVRYGYADVSWSDTEYEQEEPFRGYQYLVVNGLIFDGKNDLPVIKRYTVGRVLALMYHEITNVRKLGPFRINPAAFEHDIKTLSEEGYTFCTAEELDRVIREHRGGKFVAVTFDDGYKSDLKLAVPILKKYNARATFFVIGSLLNTRGYMTNEELKKLAESGVAQIGNHTNRIHSLSRNEFLSLCNDNPEEVLKDIEKNKQILERIVEQDVTAFSFPYGVYNEYLNNATKARGYVTFSTEEKNAENGIKIYGRYNRGIDRPIENILKKAGFERSGFDLAAK